MKLNKILNNYLLQQFKLLFAKSEKCCGEYSFVLECCKKENIWKLFNGTTDISGTLRESDIAVLDNFKKITLNCCLDNKKLVLKCCNGKKYFRIEDAVPPTPPPYIK